MPRRNHRGGTTQMPKPKDGRVRKASFWHALATAVAEGVRSDAEVTSR